MKLTKVIVAFLLCGCGYDVQAQNGLQIPTAHPRVWWTPQRLTQARAWYASNPFTPSSSDHLGQAFRYLMTGETQYARSAINYALSYTVPDLAANSSDPNTGVASDGARWEGEIIILTYDWCYDQMTPAERTTIVNRWNTYIDNLRKKPWGGPSMPQSNYYWGYLRNEFEWAVATWYENQPMAQTFLNHALTTRWQNSFIPHANTEARGGVLQEGSAYGRALVDYATIPFVSAGLLNRNLLGESNFFREAVYAIIYSTTPGRTALKADGSLHWEIFPFADDERFIDGGDAEAASWANFMTAAAVHWSNSAVGQYARRWVSMVGFPAVSYVRAVNTGGTERDFATLPLDYYAPGPGYLYGRNVWGAQSTAFHLQLGETFDEGHRHEDSGNWQIWRNGRWLSRETTGYVQSLAGYGGSGSVETHHPLAHNTLLVNRQGFPRGPRNGRPIVKRIESRTNYSYGVVDLTPAFRNTLTQYPRPELDNAAVARVEREYVFIRPLETMVIFDRAQSTDTTSVKTFLAHFERAPVTDGNNSYLAVNGDQALRVTTLVPAVPVQRVVNEGGQIGQYRLEVETSGQAQSYFLHVMQARSASGQNLQSQVTDAGDRYILTLQHPTLGAARLEFMKGATSTGGGIAYSAASLPTSVASFLDRIQGIQVTDNGPVWETLGTGTPLPPDTTSPSISTVGDSAITSTGATITWATNEPADQQVEFGTTTTYGAMTPLNSTMTTTHTVSLTGAAAGTLYHYRVRSRDAAGNLTISGDYTFTTLQSGPVQYTIAASAGAGGSVTPSGNVTVTAGTNRSFTITPQSGHRIAGVVVDGSSIGAVANYTFTNITANHTLTATFAISAPPPPPPAGTSTTVPLTVQPYAGNGPANLVSNAMPFKPGMLTDAQHLRVLDGTSEVALATKVLAVWPQDNSIRSLLLQFNAPTAPKTYTLEIGTPRTTPDAALLPVTWDLPRRIFTLPASYLSDSLIFWEQKPLGDSGFPAWDSKQLNYYSRIETLGTSTCANTDQYYDSITTTYQLYARTGDLKYLVNGRRWALHHRRDQVYLSGSLIGRGRCSDTDKTRYTFPQGLVQDYFMFGDEEAKRVSGLIADNFYMTHSSGNYYKAPNTRGWWTEREPAFALIGLMAHYEATGNASYLNRVRERVTSLHRMQVENGRRAWVHNLYDHDPSEGCSTTDWGSSPWMSGLLLEGVIQYHKLTGDPIARESVLMAVDDIRARYLATGDYANRSFIYLGCSAYRDGTPDLDNLIAHAFGYAYKLTGTQAYKTFGTTVFNTSVADGYTGQGKQYNQQFRSSGHFVAYVSDTLPPPPADSTAPAVAVTSPASGATVSSNISMTATATDNVGVVGVQFLVDGEPRGAEDTTPAYALTLDTTTLTNGSHTLSARARDAAGNQTTATVTVTVDNTTGDSTQPTVAMTAPMNNQTISGTFTIAATATDNVGVVGVQFLVDGQPRGAEDLTLAYALALNTTNLTNGSHTISARARDAAGNQRTATVTVTVNNTSTDSTRPTVALTAPANGQTISGTKTIAATATDNVGVAGVQFLVDGQPRGVEDTTPAYALALNTTTLTNGSHTISARARDAAGNQRTATVTVTVNNTSTDSTRPTVALTAPANGQTISGTKTIAATATDNVGVAGVQFLVDGQPRGVEDTTPAYALALNTTTLTNGSHTISARARDAAGNTSTATVTVNVLNTTTPTPAFTPIRINSGGTAYTDATGRVWAADTASNSGYVYAITRTIANTATPKLYQDQRGYHRPIVYTFTVPNGSYSVRLLFAEIYHSSAGNRISHINVNGQRVASNFDVFAVAGGRDRAVDRVYPVTVTNGTLVIEVVPVSDDAMLNGLEITAQ